MSYIGNTPTQQGFSPAIDYFSGTGSQTAFVCSRPIASTAQVTVVVNNVTQNPSTAFTVSGNTITFTGAPSLGVNNIYVSYTSSITQVIAPSQGTVNTTQLVDGAVTTAKIADGAVTTAKIADANVTAAKLASTLDLSAKTLTLPAINRAGVLQVSGITTDAGGTAFNTIVYGNSVTLTTVSASSRILLWVFCSSYRDSTSGSDQVGARITHAGGTILDANISSVRDDTSWNSMDGMTLLSHGVAAGTVLTITPRFQTAGSVNAQFSGLRLVAMEVI